MSILGIACIVTSCHDEEVANIEELSFRHGYEYNFVKTFGEIDPNQTWDFSSYARRKGNSELTRATVNDFGMTLDNDGYFRVPSAINTWIDQNVMEENGMANNKQRVDDALWHAFSFEAYNTDAFNLIPFYLGASECLYNFHMVVVDPDNGSVIYDDVVWDCQHTQIQWTNDDTATSTSWNDINGSQGSGGHGSTIGKGTRGKPILIDFSDPKYRLSTDNKKYTVYFYVYIQKPNSNGNSAINEKGDKLTSITHQPNLVAIDLPENIEKLTNQDGRYNAMLFACETGSAKHADKLTDGRADFDYNDFMFILVGRIPEIYYDEMLQTTTIKKRYMIEDLFDFDYDFNDIVVDVTDISVHHYIVDDKNGIKTEQPIVYNGISYPTVEQEAKFAYLCGTLPFQITIGNKTFARVTDPTDADNTNKQLNGLDDATDKVTKLGSQTGITPDYTYTYSYQYSESNPTPSPFWNPAINNISATIWTDRDLTGTTNSQSSLSGGTTAWQSEFPTNGAVPYMIATDQSVNWSPELTHIDPTWLGGDMSTDDGSYTITVVPITTTTP